MARKNGKAFFVLIIVLMTSVTVINANRAIMNPLHPIDMQEETESVNLKAELRIPAKSEVMMLLGEDETRSQANYTSKNPGPIPSADPSQMDCSKISLQIFQVLLQNPDTVEPEDYSCGLLNLISQFEKSNGRIRALESSLYTATTAIKSLEMSLHAEMSKTEFLVRELNETLHKESDRSTTAENIIAQKVLSEKIRLDAVQRNLTEGLGSSMEQLNEFRGILKKIEQSTLSRPTASGKEATNPYYPDGVFTMSEQEMQKIEGQLTSMQQYIQNLSNKISHMEGGSEENMNKGIAQMFKTYANLANEIERETERATGEETNLKNMITNEIASLAKLIGVLQDRITEEKNRVQVIENRRTADLFEEINRAKSEEARLAQKLKEDMSKAAAAFKKLEHHVEVQLNSTKPHDDDYKTFALNATRRVTEVEEKLSEKIVSERSRALSVENALKSHLDNEMKRAQSSENELRMFCSEERDRALTAENQLRSVIDAETYRAKGVEFSISAQVTAEMERAKQEEYHLQEYINSNMTRLLTDIIKEHTRAQSAEMELAEKINVESMRATGAEQSLLDNINSELSRASSKEEELFHLIKAQESSTKVADQFKILIETEAERARTAETKLETQIKEEVSRAQNSEEKIVSAITLEMANWKVLEVNLTEASKEVVRHTRELELEVRKTVMAEVARAVDAENGIKQQLFIESEKTRSMEYAMSQGLLGNYSEISTKMQDMIRDVEKDTLRLEDISLQISRNLTGDILTLAELFDDKLDDLERSENVRLKKLEEDMKKCCSGSSWRWRSPKGKSSAGATAAGTVINKIMQAFGAANEEDQEGVPSSNKRTGKGSTRKGDASKGRSMDEIHDYPLNEDDDDGQVSMVKGVNQNKDANSLEKKDVGHAAATPVNEMVVYVNSQKVVANDTAVNNNEQLHENIKVLRKKPLRSSRRASNTDNSRSNSSNNNNNALVAIQSVNSKVTSRFG